MTNLERLNQKFRDFYGIDATPERLVKELQKSPCFLCEAHQFCSNLNEIKDCKQILILYLREPANDES
jgi:hypothetical protein